MRIDDSITNTRINQRKVNRGGLTHIPSPQRNGILICLPLMISMAWLLSYTLLDWRWQQSLGARNYWIAGAAMMAFAFALRLWRNDPRTSFGEQIDAAGTPGDADLHTSA